MPESLSFEHAAGFYDATRAVSPEAGAAVADAMVRVLRGVGADRLLEIGTGTGRIARPLAERGVRVCGIDISRAMMAKFREQLPPSAVPPDLMLADATRLPFAADTFRAVLAVHVFHLVSDWRAAVRELQRVLTPGGLLIEYYADSDFGGLEAANEKWRELIAARGFQRRPQAEPEEIDADLEAIGAGQRIETVYEEEVTRTPTMDLDDTLRHIHSWSWEIPDELLRDCRPDWDTWANEFYDGDLDKPFTATVSHKLELWTFPE